jgi:hypothetical protein
LHFVVVGQREDIETFGAVLKKIPEFDGGAAGTGTGKGRRMNAEL